jgi:putative spermidine/putrescine transport system permease protein
MKFRKRTRFIPIILLVSFALYLILPQISTLLFAIATVWTTTILPQGYTLEWLVRTIHEPRFAETLQRSLILGTAVVFLDLILVVPALVVLVVRKSRWRVLLDAASLIPYTMPGVVLALALIRYYGEVLPAVLNTPWLLAAAHATLALPIAYWAVLNNLKAIKLDELYEAALTCGARWPEILRYILLPNIRIGIAVAAVAGFAASFTDFAVANFIVGGTWLTFSVWQGNLIRLNSHFMAVTSIVSFLITIVTTFLVIRLTRKAGPSQPQFGR